MLHYVTQVTYNKTGSANNLLIPGPHSHVGKRSLHYRGATLWNSLPTTSKTQTTLTGVKNLCRHSNDYLIVIILMIFHL